jgi:hypothetical protein
MSPIAIAVAMYVGFSMIKPKLAKPVAWIYGLTGIPFWINLWFNIPVEGSTFSLPNPAEDLIDIQLENWTLYGTAIYIISLLLILGSGFIWLAWHSIGEIKTRSRNYAIGIIVFSVCGIIESQFTLGLFTAVGRLVMFVGYIFLYLAMIPPKSQSSPSKK